MTTKYSKERKEAIVNKILKMFQIMSVRVKAR